MLIRLENIRKVYNEGKESEVRALWDVNLSIDHGEFTAILGQSGSGKSTLMNILGCLDTPTYGEYWLDGENVSLIPPRRLSAIRNKNIGFIFQGFNLIPALTALENVELPLIYRGMKAGERRQLALSALEEVGLGKRVHHRPVELSGGPAAAGGHRPGHGRPATIIMADEPTGNLDTKAGAEVMGKLCALNDEGATILLITHDMHLAYLAKRVVRIMDGQVVEDSITPRTSGSPYCGRWDEHEIFPGLFHGPQIHTAKQMRSFLTMLGIIIGVGSVTALVSVMQGTQRQVIEEYKKMGANTISVSFYEGRDISRDLREFCQSVPKLIVGVTPNTSQNLKCRYKNKNWSTTIYFGNEDFGLCQNYQLERAGSCLTAICTTDCRCVSSARRCASSSSAWKIPSANRCGWEASAAQWWAFTKNGRRANSGARTMRCCCPRRCSGPSPARETSKAIPSKPTARGLPRPPSPCWKGF